MGIKAKNDKAIKDMEASQICLQNNLLSMEENHAREVSAMKVEHSSQMDAITIQIQKFQHQSEDEKTRRRQQIRSFLICCSKLRLIMRRSFAPLKSG